MPLPFTIDFEPPTRPDLRRLSVWLVGVLVLALAGATLAVASGYRPRPSVADAAPPTATLGVTSTPVGAAIWIGGRERGRTPATLSLPPGDHAVTLRLDHHSDVTYAARLTAEQATTLAGVLWLTHPEATRVRPPLPGAQVAGAHFLADGRLALTLALPNSDERQLWIVDRGGSARRTGPPVARVALAPSPDGARVAYLNRPLPPPGPNGATGGVAGPPPGVSEVWITGRDGERGERVYALPPGTADERLMDLSWAPDGAHLLLVSQQRPQGAAIRTRLLWLDLDPLPGSGEAVARELISLPSEIVPGSYTWSPEGDRVALLTSAGNRTTLCLLGVAGDGGKLFRAVTDVGGEGGTPPPFPPLAWLPHGAVAYAAPLDAVAGQRGTTRVSGLFTDDFAGRPPRRVGEDSAGGPTRRDDGLLLALTRPAKAKEAVGLRAYSEAGAGSGQDLGQLPLPPGTPAGTRWDPAHGQALVALRAPGGGTAFDLWLVRWSA